MFKYIYIYKHFKSNHLMLSTQLITKNIETPPKTKRFLPRNDKNCVKKPMINLWKHFQMRQGKNETFIPLTTNPTLEKKERSK